MKRLTWILALCVTAFSAATNANALATKCAMHYAQGQAPAINNKMLTRIQEICYDNYALVYNLDAKTPLWSAEHLTKPNIDKANKLKRNDNFHEELLISPGLRASLTDYRGTGYDKGHLTPAGDAPTPSAQYQTFSLANMVPQDAKLNQGAWAKFEDSTRRIVTSQNDIYVITGPVFDGNVTTVGKAGIPVPAQVFKVIYSPSQKKTVVFLAKNDGSKGMGFVPVATLESKTGITFLPFLPLSQKEEVQALAGLTVPVVK